MSRRRDALVSQARQIADLWRMLDNERRVLHGFEAAHGQPVTVSSLLRSLLDDLDVSQEELARMLDRLPARINEIIRGEAGVTVETALQLEFFLGVPAEFWLDVQTRARLHRARGLLDTCTIHPQSTKDGQP